MVFRSLIVFITDPRISLLLVRTHSFCSSPKLYCVSNSIPNNVRAEGKPKYEIKVIGSVGKNVLQLVYLQLFIYYQVLANEYTSSELLLRLES